MADLVWGVGASSRALLVHGVTSSAQVWWRVASSLADEGVEATAVDLRGHGRSPRTTSYALDDLVSDLEWYIEREGPFDIVVGHSLGGTVTALADVSGAAKVLVDPAIDTPDPEGLREELMAELEHTPERIAADNPSWHADDVFWKWRSAAVVGEATMTRLLDQVLPFDISGAVASLDGPCSMLVADPEAGGLVSDSARAVVDGNPAVDVIDLPGVGHSVHREDPDAVVRAALDRL